MIATPNAARHAALSLLTCLALGSGPLAADDPEPPAAASAPAGQLYLVSVGIGDPDNMTLRAQKTIAGADIVFGMPMVLGQHAALLEGKAVYEAGHGLFRELPPRPTAPPGSPDADAARQRDGEDRPALEAQARRVIRDAVAAGKTVAVLDYGDPMIFGPQTGYLSEFADLSPVVVPGISSFNAANAALRRSPTGGVGSQAVILTRPPRGEAEDGRAETFRTLAASPSTLVLFTMRTKLPELVAQLKASRPGDTPIAIVFYAGFSARERVLTATLDSILAAVGDAPLPFAHLIYVGEFLQGASPE
jgi:precorrin-4/cobalt-precorrin-4 C11-methyltransferase